MEYNQYYDAATIFCGSLAGCYLGCLISPKIYNWLAPIVKEAAHQALLEHVTRTDTKKNKLEKEVDIKNE